MCSLYRAIPFVAIWIAILFSVNAIAEPIVDHYDPIIKDSALTLADIVDLTMEKYPRGELIPALKQEVEALQQRGDSWLAGAPSAFFYYVDDTLGADTGSREIDADLQLPLWNWGQRAAGQEVAVQAGYSSELRAKAIKLEVTGLVRNALWELELESNRHEMAEKAFIVSEQLVKTVKRRVELGDLPKADLLLARSESLEKRSKLVNTEAEQMHARKNYSTLTQQIRIPADYSEQQSQIKEIMPDHPGLAAMESVIKRKKAELKWVKSEGSGQTIVALGAKSERDSRNDEMISGMSFTINVPFGGGAHLAPDIAATNFDLSVAQSARDQYYRELERALHEAEHALDVNRAEQKIAEERKMIAEEHLRITRISFDAGEIGLMDLLRIQAKAHDAIRSASENAISLKHDISMYNQAVGVLP